MAKMEMNKEKEEKIIKAMEKFTKEVNEVFVGKTSKFTGDLDELYDCDIYIFRHPGMGNSKHIIMGNEISVMTATASYLENLLKQGICTEKQLKETVKMSIKAAKNRLK